MKEIEKKVIFGNIRQIIYIALLVGIVCLLWKIADVHKSATVFEFGIFETLQSAVLPLVSVIFGIQAVICKKYRPVLIALCMLPLAAFIREQDAYLDAVVPAVGWKFAWIFPVIGLYYIIRHWSETKTALMVFLQSRTMQMMFASMVVLIPIAQCLGHRSFLADLISDPTVNAVLIRRIIEEPIELIAYVQILFSSIEFYIELVRPARKAK